MKGAIEPVYSPMMGGREAIIAYAIPSGEATIVSSCCQL